LRKLLNVAKQLQEADRRGAEMGLNAAELLCAELAA